MTAQGVARIGLAPVAADSSVCGQGARCARFVRDWRAVSMTQERSEEIRQELAYV